MVKLITKKSSSEARQRADKLIRDVHKLLGKEYIFFCRPIGSQTRRCIVQDKNGRYDLDYQIVLTKRSKGDLNPTSIKKKFLWALCTYCAQLVFTIKIRLSFGKKCATYGANLLCVI